MAKKPITPAPQPRRVGAPAKPAPSIRPMVDKESRRQAADKPPSRR